MFQLMCEKKKIIKFHTLSDPAGHNIDISWKFLLGKKIAFVWEEKKSHWSPAVDEMKSLSEADHNYRNSIYTQ